MNRTMTIVIALCVIWSVKASAKSELQTCAELETTTLRLACFEKLARLEQQRTADDFASPKAGIEAPSRPVTTQVARDVMGAKKLQRTQSTLPDLVNRSDSKTTTTPKSAEEQAKDGITFTVNSSKKDGEKRQVFYMDDGQIWREIEPTQIYYPRGRGFKVVINQGRMSDYRLRLEGKGRRIRVVRLR
jgi:hypothetical protein